MRASNPEAGARMARRRAHPQRHWASRGLGEGERACAAALAGGARAGSTCSSRPWKMAPSSAAAAAAAPAASANCTSAMPRDLRVALRQGRANSGRRGCGRG